MADKKRDDALAEMLKRRDLASEACRKLYDDARDDVRFVTVPGAQWDARLKARRGDRPVYEFPKLASHVRQVVNEMRQGRPQGKVRGTEESDKGLAELMQGICRNIESMSNADQAYDIAYDFAVKGGFGAWRICTDYGTGSVPRRGLRLSPRCRCGGAPRSAVRRRRSRRGRAAGRAGGRAVRSVPRR